MTTAKMPMYERTHTRPDHAQNSEWQAGYRFEGKPTGGGIAENYHPELGPRVHSVECVRLVVEDMRVQRNEDCRRLVADMNARSGKK